MKTLKVAFLGAAAAATLLVSATRSHALFHLSVIDEVLTSLGGDNTQQFVEIRMLSGSQNVVANSVLAAFDTSGVYIADVLVVPSNVTASGAGVRWIMATTAFQTANSFTADFTIPATLPVSGGMLCWGAPGIIPPANPASWSRTIFGNYIDCLAYGNYSGPTNVHIGTPIARIPVGHGLQRGGDTNNNSVDFTCSNTITPQKNGSAAVNIPATTPCISCGDTFVDAGEQCDDGNASGGDCCSATCQFEPSGDPCTTDGDSCTVDECNATGTCEHNYDNVACPLTDHYLCYKGGQARGEVKLATTSKTLTDQLQANQPHDVKKAVGLCNPATKIHNGDTYTPLYPAIHQQAYKIALPSGASFTASNHEIDDQFGTLQLTVKKPEGLLVRAGKTDLGTTFTKCETNAECGMLSCVAGICIDPAFPPAPADNAGPDNFKCYKVAVRKGTPPFVKVVGGLVEVDDQFSASALKYEVTKPTRLCTPVDKNGENPGAETNPGHLMCYKVKLTKTDPVQPKFVKHKVAVANTNFPDTRLDVKGVTELCVPARKDM